MLIHPWDAALDDVEWQTWLAGTDRFGMLAVNNRDAAEAPLVVPAHFTVAQDDLLLHLARPNPVWPHLEAAAQVRLAAVGDYAYIPSYWRAKAGGPDEDGVPTSYYSSVQFVCRPTVVDDPQGKVDILSAQFADIQPEGQHATVAVDTPPYGRMLSGIRGIRLTVLRVDAKFKYDDHNPVEHRQRVINNLRQRGLGLDAGTATQQQRRLAAIGDWRTRKRSCTSRRIGTSWWPCERGRRCLAEPLSARQEAEKPRPAQILQLRPGYSRQDRYGVGEPPVTDSVDPVV